MGQFHHGLLIGQELHRASYGPKYVWAIHGAEVKWAGIILDGPDDATGPNSDRA